MWSVGNISHQAVYTAVVPEQYASTPACSTVLEYQPSRPTQKTAACGAIVFSHATGGTFQVALTSVNGVPGATTYPDHVADDWAGSADPESRVKVLAFTSGVACVGCAAATETDARASPVPAITATVTAFERLAVDPTILSAPLVVDLNARRTRACVVPPQPTRRHRSPGRRGS